MSLDVERIRSILGLLENALDRSDLLHEFEKVCAEESSPRLIPSRPSNRKAKKP
jgi:hypothetical protein